MKKLLVYGGTFNPIHNGHLHLGRAFLSITGAEHLLLVPTRVPPHKRAKSLASAKMRLEMCRLAVEGQACWEVSPIEIERPGPSYTADTLDELAARYPGVTLYFVTGEDMFLTLLDWHDPQRILRRAVICAAPRSHEGLSRMEAYGRKIEEAGGRTLVRDVSYLPISSTQVRNEVAAGRPIDALVPPKVARFIAENSLYREL